MSQPNQPSVLSPELERIAKLRSEIRMCLRRVGLTPRNEATSRDLDGMLEEVIASALSVKPEPLGLTSAVPNIEPMCEICGHEWRRHDPEDGKCDAGPPCFCGRNLTTMQQRIAQLSRAELSR